jgi:hypothetical protein
MLADVGTGCDEVDDLLARATDRRPLGGTDGKSGSQLERIVVDGEPYVVKRVHVDHDWTMRGWGDIGPRPVLVFEHGLLDVAPAHVDHTVVAAARWGRHDWGGVLVMRDVTDLLVAEGDEVLPAERHRRFLDDLAALCAAGWGWHDDVGLLPYASRWACFGDDWLAAERELGWPAAVPRIAADGWARFADRARPATRELILGLRRDRTPLVSALLATPSCFLHGDWKLGNLGSHPDGRTILLDCAYPGEGPAGHELAWYLALNRARMPASFTKEDAIDAFRASLAAHGVDTAGWFERQVGLCLLGALVQFGWEKALGDDDELAWWSDAAEAGARWL